MDIQWFPGHMTRALRMLEDEIKLADCVFYVLDSRAPYSCVNPKLNKICGNKPIIYVLNKADMADERTTDAWKKFFSKDGNHAISISSVKSNTGKSLIAIATKIMAEKMQKYAAKGISKPVRAMVVGVPNCGKSTLINNLCGQARAMAGNRPGVTRGKQWVRVSNNLELLDTPGTLWPSFEKQDVALNLAFIGSIKDDVLNTFELCEELIFKLRQIAKGKVEERYKLEKLEEKNSDVISQIAKKRGFLLSKGELDLDRTCTAILDDFRSGKFGKISLETPNAR